MKRHSIICLLLLGVCSFSTHARDGGSSSPGAGLSSPSTGGQVQMIASLGDGCLKGLASGSQYTPKPSQLIGANSAEAAMATTAMRAIDRASGGKLTKQLNGMKMEFLDTLGNQNRYAKVGQSVCAPARQTKGYPQFSRSCGFTNAGLIIHEIGHQVGNSSDNYGKYASAVPDGQKCQISTYCTHALRAPIPHKTRKEEFAEVFAAYLGAPGRLKSMCPKAFEFMQNTVFGDKDSPSAQGSCSPAGGGGLFAADGKGGFRPLIPGRTGGNAPYMSVLGDGGNTQYIELSKILYTLMLMNKEEPSEHGEEGGESDKPVDDGAE